MYKNCEICDSYSLVSGTSLCSDQLHCCMLGLHLKPPVCTPPLVQVNEMLYNLLNMESSASPFIFILLWATKDSNLINKPVSYFKISLGDHFQFVKPGIHACLEIVVLKSEIININWHNIYV